MLCLQCACFYCGSYRYHDLFTLPPAVILCFKKVRTNVGEWEQRICINASLRRAYRVDECNRWHRLRSELSIILSFLRLSVWRDIYFCSLALSATRPLKLIFTQYYAAFTIIMHNVVTQCYVKMEFCNATDALVFATKGLRVRVPVYVPSVSLIDFSLSLPHATQTSDCPRFSFKIRDSWKRAIWSVCSAVGVGDQISRKSRDCEITLSKCDES